MPLADYKDARVIARTAWQGDLGRQFWVECEEPEEQRSSDECRDGYSIGLEPRNGDGHR